MIGFLSKIWLSVVWADTPPVAMVSEAELKVLSNLPSKKETGSSSLKRGEWRLDGIIFNSSTDWTIWLNGQRYTPQNLPEDILISNVTTSSLEIRRDGQSPKVLCLGQVVKIDA